LRHFTGNPLRTGHHRRIFFVAKELYMPRLRQQLVSRNESGDAPGLKTPGLFSDEAPITAIVILGPTLFGDP